jgi:hypothetical protein
MSSLASAIRQRAYAQLERSGGLSSEFGYPARAMRRLAPILILVAALALSACGGGDDKKDNASTTGTTTQSTTKGTTGTTGSSGGGKTNKKKSASKNSSGGSNGNGGNSSGGSTSPSQTTTSTQTTTPSQGTPPRPAAVTPAKTAKTVCSQFLPEPIRRDIKRGKITKKKVATQYARGYPKDQRSQAYKGCLAGLNKLG